MGGLGLRRKIKFGFEYVKPDLSAGQGKWGFEKIATYTLWGI